MSERRRGIETLNHIPTEGSYHKLRPGTYIPREDQQIIVQRSGFALEHGENGPLYSISSRPWQLVYYKDDQVTPVKTNAHYSVINPGTYYSLSPAEHKRYFEDIPMYRLEILQLMAEKLRRTEEQKEINMMNPRSQIMYVFCHLAAHNPNDLISVNKSMIARATGKNKALFSSIILSMYKKEFLTRYQKTKGLLPNDAVKSYVDAHHKDIKPYCDLI